MGLVFADGAISTREPDSDLVRLSNSRELAQWTQPAFWHLTNIRLGGTGQRAKREWPQCAH